MASSSTSLAGYPGPNKRGRFKFAMPKKTSKPHRAASEDHKKRKDAAGNAAKRSARAPEHNAVDKEGSRIRSATDRTASTGAGPKSKRPSSKRSRMRARPTFRARFRFRVSKKLNLAAYEHRFVVAEREVVLSAQSNDAAIEDSEWLVMNARGFSTEEEAGIFAHQLRAAADVSSVATRLGIDSGVDRLSSDLGRIVRQRIERDHGLLIRGNVHGIDVYPDLPNVHIFSASASPTVRTQAQPFLADISRFFESVTRLSERGKDVVLLLNYALMRTDPVSRIVFAFSAVEML